SPTYYAVSITRGTQVELQRVVGGKATVIGAARSGDWISNKWVQVTLRAEGNVLKVQLRRGDTGRYLDTSGNWVSEPVNAIFVRGQGLDTAKPTYYAVSVTRGLNVQLVRVVNGQQTVLGAVRSKAWVSGQWLQVSLVAKGNELRAQVFRTDTGQYLNSDGSWGL